MDSSYTTYIRSSNPRSEGSLLCAHDDIQVQVMPDGWRFDSSNKNAPVTVTASKDYARLEYFLPPCDDVEMQREKFASLLRVAFECRMAYHDTISLHASCFEINRQAVAFSAPSGTGKSTRAATWVSGFGAIPISDDRPAIRLDGTKASACGVPWDGKGRVHRQVEVPLFAICEIRRSPFTRIRRLSKEQARQILMNQCFIPSWDHGATVAIMGIVSRLIDRTNIYRLFCGPDEDGAKSSRDILFHFDNKSDIKEAASDMKIKSGFILRNIVGEKIVMPVGENINKFEGALVLNEVSAFIWEKLQQPIAREDLLDLILAEYDVERDSASRDLDAFLKRLDDYQILEEEKK